MYLVFLTPMVVACASVIYFWAATDADLKWKILAATLLVVSLVVQWVPAVRLHFLVPLVLQVLISLWMIFYFKLEG